MKQTMFIVGIVFLIIILCFASIRLYNSWITPDGNSVTKEQIENDIKKIIAQEGLQGGVSIYEDKVDFLKEYPKSDLEDGYAVIYIGMHNKPFQDVPKSYNEVRVNVRLWLYIKSHEMPFKTDGTFMHFSKVLQGGSTLILLAEEFEQFYQDNVTLDMSEKEIIDTLTEVIIREKNYKRNQGSEPKG